MAAGDSRMKTADRAHARSGSARRDRARTISRPRRVSAWREGKPAHAGARRL